MASLTRSLVVALSLAAVVAGCGTLPREGVLRVDRAALVVTSSTTPPPDDDPGWTPVSLPDLWRAARRREGIEGWYRLDLALERAPAELWAVYLPRVVMNAAVLVNGRLVGDGGRFAPRVTRNWNRPLLFTVPAGLLAEGGNVVHVRLGTTLSSPGLLSPIAIGPERLLRPAWALRTLQQVTLAQVAGVATFLIALLVSVVYLRRDPAGQYRWFAAAALFWTWTALDTLVRNPPVPSRLWEWSTQTAVNLVAPCFVFAAHRSFGLHRPGLERLIVAVALLGALGLALVSPFHSYVFFLVWATWSLALAGYLAALFTRATRSGAYPRSRPFQLAGLAAVLLGLHDVVSLLAGRAIDAPLLSLYIPPIAMVAAGWAIVSHLAAGLTEAEQLNLELERRVEEKGAELARNYERLRELERDRAVADERDRIMQDMHDGMGGHLVSTLAMVESGRANPEALAEALRDALDDMRLVIDSLDPVEGNLLTLLGMVRVRLEPRLERHGIRFVWEVADLPPLSDLGPEAALQVLRIVQEAITNVLKHAEARTITVRTGTGPGADGGPGVFVEIRDDGRGRGPLRPGGRGVAHMRSRAGALGGEVTIAAAADGGNVTVAHATPGTSVRIWLPLEGRPAMRAG